MEGFNRILVVRDGMSDKQLAAVADAMADNGVTGDVAVYDGIFEAAYAEETRSVLLANEYDGMHKDDSDYQEKIDAISLIVGTELRERIVDAEELHSVIKDTIIEVIDSEGEVINRSISRFTHRDVTVNLPNIFIRDRDYR